MSEQRIEKSKAAIEAADDIPAEKKAELLESLAKLKPAIAKVSPTHKEDAQTIARLLEASTHEATRKEKRVGRTADITRRRSSFPKKGSPPSTRPNFDWMAGAPRACEGQAAARA